MDSSRSWASTAYHTSLPDGRANGRITVEQDALVFTSDATPPLSLPLADIDIRYGGFNNQQAYLSHGRLPSWTFLCTDPAMLKDDVIAGHPVHGRKARRTHRATKKWPWPAKALIALTILFLAGITALWTFRSSVTAYVADKIPVSIEKSLGDTVYEQVRATSKASEDPALAAQLEEITKRLVPAIKDKRYEFKFHIIENDTINAFAMPGGHIVVHTALLKKAKRPEEIAGVLAHEIAHITRRHSLRNMVSSLGTTAVLSAIFGDMSGVVDGAASLLGQKYSRDFEREADETGFQYMLDAKIDPQGMIDFFATLAEEEKKAGTGMAGALEFFSTHPATEDRMSALKDQLKKVPAGTTYEPISK
jgi:beta-barrel assembly-enhancing protease